LYKYYTILNELLDNADSFNYLFLSIFINWFFLDVEEKISEKINTTAGKLQQENARRI